MGGAGTRWLIFPFDKSTGAGGAFAGNMHTHTLPSYINTHNRLHVRSLQVVTPSVRSNRCFLFFISSSCFLPAVIFKYFGDVWIKMYYLDHLCTLLTRDKLSFFLVLVFPIISKCHLEQLLKDLLLGSKLMCWLKRAQVGSPRYF